MIVRMAIVWLLNSALGKRLLACLFKRPNLLLCYPATQAHALHYCTRRVQDRCTWTPRIVGIARHQRRFTLLVAIGATPSDLQHENHADRLAAALHQVHRLAAELDARQVSHAGMLPALLQAHRLLGACGDDMLQSAHAVFRTVLALLRAHPGRLDGVVVIGADGPVGRQLWQMLSWPAALGPDAVHGLALGDAMRAIGRLLVVNCAEPAELGRLARSIPAGSIVLDETYPAPKPSICRLLAGRGVLVYHLAGVQGNCWPALPGDLQGALPLGVVADGDPARLVVRQLNAAPWQPAGAPAPGPTLCEQVWGQGDNVGTRSVGGA